MAQNQYSIAYKGYVYDIEVVHTQQHPTILLLYGRLNRVSPIDVWDDSFSLPEIFQHKESGEVVIPDLSDNEYLYIEEIGAFAFDEAVKCSKLTLPGSCAIIRNKAFYFNNSITELTFPESGHMTLIEPFSFVGHNALMRIKTNTTFESISTRYGIHDNLLYEKRKIILGEQEVSKKIIVLGSNLTNLDLSYFDGIGEGAFSYCFGIRSLMLPNKDFSIGKYAFSDCDGLTSLTIPGNIHDVGYGAFFGCTGIEKVTIEKGEGTQSLGGLSFAGMPNLMVVQMTDAVTSIGTILGEETFTDGGRRLLFDAEPNSLYPTVEDKLTGTVGKLPETVEVNYYTDPTKDPIFSSSVQVGATLAASMEEAKQAVAEKAVIEGWYYDIGLRNGASKTDEVTNFYRGANGEVEIRRELKIYAQYSEIVDFSEVYTVKETDGKLTLIGVKDWDKLIESDYLIPSALEYEGVSYTVTALGDSLFEGRRLAPRMDIPNSIRTIGKAAFRACTDMTSVTFEEGSKCTTIGALAFAETNLNAIELPDSVKTIRKGTFYNCTALQSISFGKNISSIGKEVGSNHGTFEGCESLVSINAYSLDSWLGISFGNSACNPLSNGGILYVDEVAVTSIAAQEIGAIEEIKDFAFVGCSGLQTVNLAESGVIRIGVEAFSACANLTELAFPTTSLTTLGRAAFSACTALETVAVPGSVQNIGEFAFNSCENLQNLTLAEGVPYISDSMFSYCTKLHGVMIPTTVTYIGRSAFSADIALTSVVFDDSGKSLCETMKAYAFYGCTALQGFRLGAENDLGTLGDYCFANCSTLGYKEPQAEEENVITLYEVWDCGKHTFANCISLKNLSFTGNEPTADEIFSGIPPHSVTITVPNNSTWTESIVSGEWQGQRVVVVGTISD